MNFVKSLHWLVFETHGSKLSLSFIFFIAILCAKMSRVTCALRRQLLEYKIIDFQGQFALKISWLVPNVRVKMVKKYAAVLIPKCHPNFFMKYSFDMNLKNAVHNYNCCSQCSQKMFWARNAKYCFSLKSCCNFLFVLRLKIPL